MTATKSSKQQSRARRRGDGCRARGVPRGHGTEGGPRGGPRLLRARHSRSGVRRVRQAATRRRSRELHRSRAAEQVRLGGAANATSGGRGARGGDVRVVTRTPPSSLGGFGAPPSGKTRVRVNPEQPRDAARKAAPSPRGCSRSSGPRRRPARWSPRGRTWRCRARAPNRRRRRRRRGRRRRWRGKFRAPSRPRRKPVQSPRNQSPSKARDGEQSPAPMGLLRARRTPRPGFSTTRGRSRSTCRSSTSWTRRRRCCARRRRRTRRRIPAHAGARPTTNRRRRGRVIRNDALPGARGVASRPPVERILRGPRKGHARLLDPCARGLQQVWRGADAAERGRAKKAGLVYFLSELLRGQGGGTRVVRGRRAESSGGCPRAPLMTRL